MTNPPYPQQPSAPQPYAQQPYPGAAPVPRPAEGLSRKKNPAGLVSVILVAAALGLQLVSSIGSAALISNAQAGYETYGLFIAVFAVLQGLVAIAAIVLGAIGLAARDRPRALAGIGLGGGSVILFGLVSSQLTSLLLYALG